MQWRMPWGAAQAARVGVIFDNYDASGLRRATSANAIARAMG